MNKIVLTIGGDVCPSGQIEKFFCSGESEKIFHDLLDEFKEADLTIVNLEVPLIKKENPILKSGPALSAKAECIKGFVESGVNIVSLANNHILDHGAEGLLSTLDNCKDAGIDYVGAGRCLDEAKKVLVKNIKGKKIGFYAMAEHEFSIASPTSAGANPLDIIDFVYMLQTCRDKLDHLIVLYHGGVEHYSYPSSEMMKRCRFMIDMGASAVICSHCHCAVPYELYNGCPIMYGLGNLIFEDFFEKAKSEWFEGYLTKLIIPEAGNISFEIVPYQQSRGFVGAKKMKKESESIFLKSLQKRSEEIQHSNLIEEKWREYCSCHAYSYLRCLFAYNKVLGKLNKYKIFSKLFHSQHSILCSFDMVQCESHREVIYQLLKNYISRN
ncbi:MAG: CapA family protein [Planctomycetes bacterium]|nr:CapA family protein [Planctomycetota bacterium]